MATPQSHRHHQLGHRDLAGVDIHLHLGELGRERGWAIGRHVRGGAHDLLLVLPMQRVQRDLLKAHRAAVGRVGTAVAQLDGAGLVHLEQHGGPLLEPDPHRLRGPQRGRAGDVGGGRGVGAGVERGHVGVAGVHLDVVEGHAEHLGRDLADDGVGAGAEVGGPDEHVERAVVVELDRAAAHVQERDGRAVHAEGEAQAPPDVRTIGRGLPGLVAAAVPADLSPSLSNALLDARRHHLRVLVELVGGHGPLAEVGGDVHLVAHLHPVAALEIDHIEIEGPGNVLHVGLQGEFGLGRAVAPVGARHRDVGVDDVAVEALGCRVVRCEAAQPRHDLNGEAVGAVGAGVADDAHLLGQQRAVVVHRGAERDGLGVAGAAGVELLGPVELEAHRGGGW